MSNIQVNYIFLRSIPNSSFGQCGFLVLLDLGHTHTHAHTYIQYIYIYIYIYIYVNVNIYILVINLEWG